MPRAALLVPALALASACGGGTPPPRLVVLISVDTLRADRLGAYGSQRALTPNLDRLAEDSLVFEAAYAPASFTVPSISSLLTGRYPEENGILSNEYGLADEVATLATRLDERGYATGAVISNWVLRKEVTGLDRGFDHFDERFQAREVQRGLPERVATATTDDAVLMLDRLIGESERAFLWVHYQDPHGPYTPPEAYLRAQLPAEMAREDGQRELPLLGDHTGFGGIPNYQQIGDERRKGYYVAAYGAEVRYADDEIGRLLAELERRGLYEEAVIVFVADHGEGMGENEYWFAHGARLDDPLVRVPLLLHAPGVAPGRRADVAAVVDVLPTLLGLVGAPDRALGGRDLLGPGAAGVASSVYLSTLEAALHPRVGLIQDGYELVGELQRDGQVLPLSLVRSGGDGRDLRASEPALVERMVEALHERRRELYDRRVAAQKKELSAEDHETLKGLGYLEGKPDEH